MTLDRQSVLTVRRTAVHRALPGTAREIAQRTGMTMTLVYQQLKLMREEGTVHVIATITNNTLLTNVYGLVPPREEPNYLSLYEGLQ